MKIKIEGSNSKADFEDTKTTFSSTESVVLCDMNKSDKNYFNYKLILHTFPSRILKYFQEN